MAIYVCKKCGMKFDSKCIKTRSVFAHQMPNGERAPMGWGFMVDDIKGGDTELFTPEEIKCGLCDHELEIESGSCLFGCCRKGE